MNPLHRELERIYGEGKKVDKKWVLSIDEWYLFNFKMSEIRIW